MTGTLIPPWLMPSVPTCDDLTVVSIVWGLSLGLSIFGVFRAGDQTYHQWRRTQRVTSYMVLIWLELITSTVIGAISWAFVYQAILPSFEFYFFLLVLWVFQIHCIMQIIINRIALLSVSRTTVKRLRWGTFAILALINISVFCVWIPAQLQISRAYVHINSIWDRIEKGLFAVIDAALNFYFIYLVRSSLISYGLKKYIPLYRFNIAMIFVSITMDVLIIAAMSVANTFFYVIFHPLAYLVKLHIELWMASLIAKIVKAASMQGVCHCICHDDNNLENLDGLALPAAPPTAISGSGKMAPITGMFRRSRPYWPGQPHLRDRWRRHLRTSSSQTDNGLIKGGKPAKLAHTRVSSWRPQPATMESNHIELGHYNATTVSSQNTEHDI